MSTSLYQSTRPTITKARYTHAFSAPMTPPPTPSKRNEKARFGAVGLAEEGSVDNLQQTARHVEVRDRISPFRVDEDATEGAERPSSFDAEHKRTQGRALAKDKTVRNRKRRRLRKLHAVEVQSTSASATKLGSAKNDWRSKDKTPADFATNSGSPLHHGYLSNEERRTGHPNKFNPTPKDEQMGTAGDTRTKQHRHRLNNTANLTFSARSVRDSEQATAAIDAIGPASTSGHVKGPLPPTKSSPRKKRKHSSQRSPASRNKDSFNETARHINHPPKRKKTRHQPPSQEPISQPTPISRDLELSIDPTSDSEPDLSHLLAHIPPFQNSTRFPINPIPDFSSKSVSDFLLPSDCTMNNLRPVILATFEFLGGMQQEQNALCVQTCALETQLKKLQSREEPDYAKIQACEDVLGLTVGFCSDLFLAEYMFRNVLDAESENEAFELEDALAVLRAGVGRLVDEFDAEMARMPDVLGCEQTDDDGRRGKRKSRKEKRRGFRKDVSG